MKLPIALQNELGLQSSNHRSRRRPGTSDRARSDRKPQRSADRGNARQLKEVGWRDAPERKRSNAKTSRYQGKNSETARNETHFPSDLDNVPSRLRQERSLQQYTDRENLAANSQNSSESSRESSPELVLDAASRSFQHRSAQDDAEIAALEKKLKKGSSTDDGALDFLLEGIDAYGSGNKRRQEERDWLQRKRRKHELDKDSEEESASHESYTDDTNGAFEHHGDSETGSLSDGGAVSEQENGPKHIRKGDPAVSGKSASAEHIQRQHPAHENESSKSEVPKPRENPYTAPVPAGTPVTKYVPPSLRNRSDNDHESLSRLRKQTQGHINKLSEANLLSILGEVEHLYRMNPRQDVTTVLIDVLLNLFANHAALQNTTIILHAAFIAAVYKVVGTDFGAEVLARLVKAFDTQYKDFSSGKQSLNTISLLANLFTFNVVGSNIVFDYIRLLLSDFNEANAELLLRVVRDCGPQLRTDNPAALKSIVGMMNTTASELAKKGQPLNVRTKVMMDTITDLKNNKMKGATSDVGHAGEHITRMRKALGSLNKRNLKATEPLRLTKHDIENSTKTGKWWLVGASWKGAGDDQSHIIDDHLPDPRGDSRQVPDDDIDYIALAKQFKMNTDVRRSIFVAIMSAEDIQDAQVRLLKLRLTNKQEQEIAKVLLRCSRAEPMYNPYYTLLAKKLCKENKRIRMGLQFSLWAFFNAIGERADEEESDADDESQDVEVNEVINLAKMFAHLIYHGQFSLGVLKTLGIGMLKEHATLFLEALLISIFTQSKANDDTLMKVFGRTAETPQLVKSLQYFVKRNVRRSDLVSEKDRRRVKDGCKVADVAFSLIESQNLDLD